MSKNLLQKYVKFPDDQSAQKTVKEEFKCCGLEGVLGTVDCTHVAIIAPSNDRYHHESNYVNIRGGHSINVQLETLGTLGNFICIHHSLQFPLGLLKRNITLPILEVDVSLNVVMWC
ncbi:unnamed protein product [Larinioides sclopetarius]|uniref:Nuclease HARBI1 n=1 Tax=Larinioides sclopetarius TaxID=280406 RepID=A0AAV2BRF9_9ARAC